MNLYSMIHLCVCYYKHIDLYHLDEILSLYSETTTTTTTTTRNPSPSPSPSQSPSQSPNPTTPTPECHLSVL